MCRSSRILAFLLCCTAAATTSAQARVGLHAMPHVVPAPGIRSVPSAPRLRAGIRAPFRGAVIGRGRRVRYGTGLGVLGFDGAGFGVATAGAVPVPDIGMAPPIFAVEPPPPCAPPLIIAIGHGLRHVARARVVYGAPAKVCGAR